MSIIRRANLAACAFVVFAALVSACTEGETKTYKLYFLGGQSNMVGYGFVEELPDELNSGIENVMIFAGQSAYDGDRTGGKGVWAPLQPGHGKGFTTDGRSIQLSDRFGPELSFGVVLSANTPETGIALVKYALGGTGLAPGVGHGSWHPTQKNGNGLNQFDHALKTLRNALSDRDIDGDGVRDRLVPAGIVWMQGESDANRNLETAEAYEENLTHLVRALRRTLKDDELPVVIGKITDSGMSDDGSVMDYIANVQAAQASFVAADRCVELVAVTENLNYLDRYHYDTDGFIQLGEAFADAVLRLEHECQPARQF